MQLIVYRVLEKVEFFEILRCKCIIGGYELEDNSGITMNPLHRRILNNRLTVALSQCNHCTVCFE